MVPFYKNEYFHGLDSILFIIPDQAVQFAFFYTCQEGNQVFDNFNDRLFRILDEESTRMHFEGTNGKRFKYNWLHDQKEWSDKTSENVDNDFAETCTAIVTLQVHLSHFSVSRAKHVERDEVIQTTIRIWNLEFTPFGRVRKNLGNLRWSSRESLPSVPNVLKIKHW